LTRTRPSQNLPIEKYVEAEEKTIGACFEQLKMQRSQVVFCILNETDPYIYHMIKVLQLLASYASHRRERKHICMNGEKDDLRGTETRTCCYPGRCPKSIRLEGASNSPFSVGKYHHRR
jgi:hypothetical protein